MRPKPLRERILKYRLEFFLWLYHGLALVLIGLSAFPAVVLLYGVWKVLQEAGILWRLLGFSLCLAPAYFIFGLAFILWSGILWRVLGFQIRPGVYRIQTSWRVIQWMGYNSLVLVANALFIDSFRVSPLQVLFYRAMGARIGKRVRINTAGLADLALIEIGDDSMIGGGVTLIAHIVDRGCLKLAPIKIGKRVFIGLGCVILPGVEIGDGAVIQPQSFLPPGTRVKPGERYGRATSPMQDFKVRDIKEALS